MRGPPLVRPARVADAPRVAAALMAAFREFEPLYTPEAFAATTPSAESISARLNEGPTWIVDRSGSVAGTVAALERDDGVYLRSMAVVPSARGRGVGRALLSAVESWARQAHAGRIYLSTTPFLAAAIHLYEAAGFSRTDQPPFELHGTPLFTMEKRLSYTEPSRPPPAHP